MDRRADLQAEPDSAHDSASPTPNVAVNGTLVLDAGRHTGATAGWTLRHRR